MTADSRTCASVQRPLDLGEWWLWLVDRAGPMNCVIVAEIDGPLTSVHLRHALDALQQRHPLLQTRVVMGRSGQPEFRTDHTPPVPLNVVHSDTTDWHQLAEHQLATRFDTTEGPLARCVLLTSQGETSHIVLSFHHLIGDGVSGISLARDLIQAASELIDRGTRQLDRLPPLQGMTQLMPAWARGWQGVWGAFRNSLRSRRTGPMDGPPVAFPLDAAVPMGSRIPRLLPLHFDGPLTQRLLEQCRRQRATLYGALAAAQLLAIAQEFPASPDVRLALGTPVNLRHRLEPAISSEQLGLYSTIADSVHRVSDGTGFWDLARESLRTLRVRLKQRDPMLLSFDRLLRAALLRRTLPLHDRGIARFVRRLEQETVTGSVLSVLPAGIPTDFGVLQLRAAHGCLSQPRFPWLSVSTVSGGRLYWNFHYHEPAIDGARARRLADRTESLLRSAVDAAAPGLRDS